MTTEYSGGGDPKRSIELLWGVTRPKRGPKPKLTVEAIARAAVETADADGLDALSMRRVADRLGVSTMSLYTYVPGKAELLDLMLNAVVGEVPTSRPRGGWRARLERIARDIWDLYLRHPWLLQVSMRRPVLGPNVIARYDHELSAVDGLGLTDIEMDLLVSLVGDYVHGAVRGAVEAARAEQRTGLTDEQWWAAFAPLLEKVFDPERFPVAARVGAAAGADYNAPSDPARGFEFGLRLLLDGVEAFIDRRQEGQERPERPARRTG